jgi:putative membrane protein
LIFFRVLYSVVKRKKQCKGKLMNIKHKIRIFLIGAAMGVANIIPGVSGGTIAVVFGIYEDLMEALGNFLTDKTKRWQYIKFLTVLFAGALVSIVSLARVLSWSFEHYPLPTVYFFLGLIIGSIPVVIKSHPDMNLSSTRVIAFFIGLVAVIALALMQHGSGGETAGAEIASLSIGDYMYFIFSGAIAASAMIIPGVSGSFILILLGVYWKVLGALSGLTSTLLSDGFTAEMITKVAVLGSLFIGVVIGILIFSRVMSWALKHYPAVTMYMILGLIVGSIYQIFPGFEMSLQGIISLVTLAIGIVISLKFGVEKGSED